MTIYNNVDSIKASFDAMGSLANAVSGLPDNYDYSAKAESLGAGLYSVGGRYDTLQLSPEYVAISENSLLDVSSGTRTTNSISAIGGNISPETMTQAKVVNFFAEANDNMIEISLELLKDTIAGVSSINVHNAPENAV